MDETLPSTTKEDPILLVRGEDNLYKCLKCGHKLEEYDAMRMHYKRSHGLKVERKRKKTEEEKNENARLRKVRFNERKSAARALEALSKHRPLFSFADAQLRGTYGADNPNLTSMESSIPTAGYGVFAAVDLREGDVVTSYDGYIVYDMPADPTYVLSIDIGKKPAWIDGLSTRQLGKGLGSFVNREDRTKKVFKNCEYLQHGKKMFIRVTKTIKSDSELFTVYGPGYRFKSDK
ncbi:hypothetical protein AeRB84_019289 [Aphanomyces euteiches]|nr:hypothetical protein AeRB84_019289 [Aphanomyces euteiches]